MPYTTSHTLLQKLRSGDELAWYRFREFYKPLIAIRGNDLGLTPTENDALIQDVLLACHRENVLTNFDLARGRFRDYLRTVITRVAQRLLAARAPEPPLPTEEEWSAAAEDELAARWETECQEFIREKALEELRDTLDAKTYLAFELHALNEMPAPEVAKILELTPNQVYIIRTRTAEKLRQIVARLQREL